MDKFAYTFFGEAHLGRLKLVRAKKISKHQKNNQIKKIIFECIQTV